MTWKHFPYYWPFVRGTHQSLVDSPHKGPVMQSFDVSFVVSQIKLLNKLWSNRWFQMPWRSRLWLSLMIIFFSSVHAVLLIKSMECVTWQPSPGLPSWFPECSQVSATHLKIIHLQMKSAGVQSPNKLLRLDLQIGHQDIVPVITTRQACPITHTKIHMSFSLRLIFITLRWQFLCRLRIMCVELTVSPTWTSVSYGLPPAADNNILALPPRDHVVRLTLVILDLS